MHLYAHIHTHKLTLILKVRYGRALPWWNKAQTHTTMRLFYFWQITFLYAWCLVSKAGSDLLLNKELPFILKQILLRSKNLVLLKKEWFNSSFDFNDLKKLNVSKDEKADLQMTKSCLQGHQLLLWSRATAKVLLTRGDEIIRWCGVFQLLYLKILT